jgi:hypothetical protein
MEPIRFRCPSCDRSLKAPADKAGREAKCKCGATVVIPSPSTSDADLMFSDDDLRLKSSGDFQERAAAELLREPPPPPAPAHDLTLEASTTSGGDFTFEAPPRGEPAADLMPDFTLEKTAGPSRPAADGGPGPEAVLPLLQPPPVPAGAITPAPPVAAAPAAVATEPAEDMTYGLIDEPVAPPPPPRAKDDTAKKKPAKGKATKDDKAKARDGVATRDEKADGESDDEEGRPRKRKGAGLRTAPEEPERWHAVRRGMLFVAAGLAVWAASVFLQRAFVLAGASTPMQYSYVAERELGSAPEDPQPGESRTFYRSHFLLALVAGEDHFTLALWLVLMPALLLMLGHVVLTAFGYLSCLSAPPDHGTRFLLMLCLGTALGSFFLVFVFQLLPALGVLRSSLILFEVPEVAMLSVNAGRLYPLHVAWGWLPGVEVFVTLVFTAVILAEPVLFAAFLRACALTLKVESIDRNAQALVKLGLGTAFINLAYLLLAQAGTSDVLLLVLRVIYLLGTGFLLGQLVWFVFVLLRTRSDLERVLRGEWVD